MCLPKSYAEVHAGAILHPQTKAECRRLDSAKVHAHRISDRPRHRIHPELEARNLEDKWGVARETAVLVCSLLKEQR